MDTKKNTNEHELLFKELSYEIQGAAIEVRKYFGSGHKESVYQKAFAEELELRKLKFEREKAVKVYSPKTGKYIGIYRPDFIVEDKVVVEIKSATLISKMFLNQIFDYLRNSVYELGYLINFASPSLYIKRVIYTNDRKKHLSTLVALSALFVCISVLTPAYTKASTLHTVSANQTVEEGQSFEVDWLLDTGAASINTVDLKLRFNPDVLEATEAAPGDSLLNLWIKPPVFDNAKGTLEMTGGIANGAMGQNIPLFRSVFKAKAAGSAEITMDPESQNLKNDGSGSPEALTFTALSFPVVSKGGLGAVVTSETHPNQDAWYKSGDVRLKFAKQAGTDYSYSFSRNPDIYPDNQSMDVPEVIEYKGLPDGVYYFKVNSKVSDNAWKEDGIFRVQIDSTPPETFQPILGSDAGINSGRSFISFSAIDKTSGIAHYEARSGWLSPWKKTGSPMMASRTFAGDRIAIRAYDQAGNYRETEIEYKGYINSSNVWLCLLAASAVVVGLLLFVIRRRKNSVRTNKNGK